MRFCSPLLFVFAILAASAVRGDDASIADLQAHESAGEVSVKFSMKNAFENGEIDKALRSGLPTGFTYHVKLVRKRPNWFDDTLTTCRIEVIATFNSVTQEYLLNYRRDRKLVRSETFSDLAALKRNMTTIDEAKLFRIGRYRPSKLVISAKADVISGYLLYVVPWDFSTNWRETRVKSIR